MQKFHFSLERMKRYKDEILDKEKNTLMRMRRERDRLDDKIATLLRQYGEVNTEMVQKTQDGISVPEMRSYRFQLENIHRQVKELEMEKERAEIRIERQLHIVLAASQEVAGLGKLKEKQLEEYRQMEAKAEELMISEFVSTKLVRERRLTGA